MEEGWHFYWFSSAWILCSLLFRGMNLGNLLPSTEIMTLSRTAQYSTWMRLWLTMYDITAKLMTMIAFRAVPKNQKILRNHFGLFSSSANFVFPNFIRKMRIMEEKPTRKSKMFVCLMFLNISHISTKNSEVVRWRPKSFFTWPVDMVTEAAQMKPVMTGWEMKLTMNPSLARPRATRIIPTKNDRVTAMFGSEMWSIGWFSSTGHVLGLAQAAATRADMIAVGPREMSLLVPKIQ